MWTFQRCVPAGVSIVAPEAPLPDPIGGFSWWLAQEGPKREKIQGGAFELKKFIVEYLQEKNLQPRKIVAVGFSQGAVTLSLIMQEEPKMFDGVALLAGSVFKENSFQKTGDLPRVFIAHGTHDEIVPIQKAYDGRDWLLQHGFNVQFVEDPVGHKIGSLGMRGLKEFLSLITP